jgi:hypothetical protein
MKNEVIIIHIKVGKKLQPSSVYRPSLTAKFSKVRLYTMKGSDTMKQWFQMK